MASLHERLPENVPGQFFVDSSCIDCAVCREVAPEVFTAADSATDQSYVHRQPADERTRHRAAMALVACPTSSIGTERKIDLRAATRAFPERLDDQVCFCGYASEKTSPALAASRSVCWHSWPEQTRSMERLLAHRFTWVLPGHGRRYRAVSPEAAHDDLRRLLAAMR